MTSKCLNLWLLIYRIILFALTSILTNTTSSSQKSWYNIIRIKIFKVFEIIYNFNKTWIRSNTLDFSLINLISYSTDENGSFSFQLFAKRKKRWVDIFNGNRLQHVHLNHKKNNNNNNYYKQHSKKPFADRGLGPLLKFAIKRVQKRPFYNNFS